MLPRPFKIAQYGGAETGMLCLDCAKNAIKTSTYMPTSIGLEKNNITA